MDEQYQPTRTTLLVHRQSLLHFEVGEMVRQLADEGADMRDLMRAASAAAYIQRPTAPWVLGFCAGSC